MLGLPKVFLVKSFRTEKTLPNFTVVDLQP